MFLQEDKLSTEIPIISTPATFPLFAVYFRRASAIGAAKRSIGFVGTAVSLFR